MDIKNFDKNHVVFEKNNVYCLISLKC